MMPYWIGFLVFAVILLCFIINVQRKQLAVYVAKCAHMEWKESRERIEKVLEMRRQERMAAEMEAKMETRP